MRKESNGYSSTGTVKSDKWLRLMPSDMNYRRQPPVVDASRIHPTPTIIRHTTMDGQLIGSMN
jgi:hypothetical protein